MLPEISERVYHAALYLIAAVVLLLAVAITGIRLALPGIDQYKSTIETWAGRYMEQTISVDTLRAEWQGWTPRLILAGVHLRSRQDERNIISFDTAVVEISPFRSLWKRQLAPRRIVVSGLDVSVSRLIDGALLVQGIHIDPARGEQENEFVKWLFGQKRIEVQETTVTWTDHKHQQAPIQLTDVHLLIRTDGVRSQVSGELSLPGKYGEKLNFALDATGDLWSHDWSGELYAAATKFNPDSWYREYRPRQLTPAGGSADLELWSSWEAARPTRLQGRLAYNNFVLLSAAESLNISALSGHFMGEKLPDEDWRIALKLDRLITENGSWPTANLEFVVPATAQRRRALSFDYLNLADLLPLASDLGIVPAALKTQLNTASISGELLDGTIMYDERPEATEALVYDVVFRHLDAGLGANRPAVRISSGRARGSGSRGGISINGATGRISMPTLYSHDLQFSRLDGSWSWTRTALGWELRTDRFHLENADLSLALRGILKTEDTAPAPYLELVAELRSQRLEKLYNYMPYTPKFRIREWMERSLHAGHVDSAVAVLRGYPHEFPFRNNNGQMRGVVYLSQSIVEYSTHWPAVYDADAEIVFDNEKMTADISSGNVFNARITGANGAIRDLTARPKVVLLEGSVKGAEKDLESFITQSPLAQDLMISHANKALVAGEFDLDLDMSIPIKAPQLQSVIDGTLELKEAKLVSDTGDVELEQINGAVGFTRDSVSGSGLSAMFIGKPVSLSMSGAKNSPDTPPAFVIDGHATDSFIIEQISERFPGAAQFAAKLGERLSGSADWQTRFIFRQGPEGLVQQLEIESDLYGLALDLPKPLWKPTYSRKPLTIRKTLEQATPVEFDYHPGIHAKLLTDADNRIEKLDVALGEGFRGRTSDAGVTLSGYTDKLLLGDWREAIAFFTPEQGAEAGFFSSTSINIDIKAGLLSAFGQSFSANGLQARREQGDWTLSLQGESLSGEIILPRDPSLENRVQLRLDKLVLGKTDDGKAASAADPKTLPPIQAEIADLTYGDLQLGSMRLDTAPSADGISFEQIEFSKPEMTINGAGLWEKPFNRNKSYFTINLKADKFHKMLDGFGYDAAAIKAGKTDIAIDAGWEGSPAEFSLDKLAGTFEIRVKKGRLLEVSPAAGRLFGLLSIQSLPRRLTLDFTDLFGKGLAFDRITGSFNIASGNAYTNDLHLSGPSVDVLISGRTGLADYDYDQLVTVTPQFADNLPVASALLGPIGIGVGAALYLAGNMFESINENIDKMLSHQYTISGNWYNPKIEKLKTRVEGKQAKAPAPQHSQP